MTGRKKKRQLSQRARRRKQQRRIQLGCMAAGCALVLFGLVYVSLYRYVNKVDKKVICDNVYRGETDVSGMTAKEAKAAVQKRIRAYGAMTLTMKVEEQSVDVPLSELGLDVKDIDKLAGDAVSYGKKGSVFARYHKMRKLKKEKMVFDEKFCVDDDAVESVIHEKANPLEQAATDAKISRSGDGFVITDEKEGKTVNLEESRKKIADYLNQKWKYKDASLELVVETEQPKIKREDLESIQDELASYSTNAGYGDRVQNLVRGAELLNGSVIMPGEEFSVEQATLPYTEENGYVDGGAYENGEIVQSIAGGICQVSTTLYNAVLYAELEVTMRYPHSMMVSYVQPSRDAAIAEGLLDFRFKNNYDTPILIEGYIDAENQLQFHIYGKDTRPKGHSVAFESETLETVKATEKYVEDTENAIGYMETKGSAIDGSTARLWKIVYENNEEVSRDVINNSTYSPTEVKIMVGTASDTAEASQLVREAIATQDKSKIQEAISKAQTMVKGSKE